jgi:hypothetical protein
MSQEPHEPEQDPGPLEPVEGEPGWSDDEPEPETPERVRTGAERVDEVIRAVEELEERPLEEHVGVFESAQVQLRRALDDPGDDDLDHGDDHPGHA